MTRATGPRGENLSLGELLDGFHWEGENAPRTVGSVLDEFWDEDREAEKPGRDERDALGG